MNTEPAAEASLDTLLALLDIETIDTDLYRGQCTTGQRDRVYGGQVAAQALVAAAQTVGDDRRVHSLHSYFMRPGDPTIPIVYDVDRLRDGRSFTTRRVRARQRGKAIFSLEASFSVPEPSGLVQHTPSAPDSPDPESLPKMIDLVLGMRGRIDGWGELLAFDWRVAFPTDLAAAKEIVFWFKPRGALGSNSLTHYGVMAYASDFTLLSHALTRHGLWFGDKRLMIASLDHSMWFHHADPIVDQWLCYEVSSPVATGGRSLARGRIYDPSGQILASTAQEGLTRTVTSPEGS